MKNLLFVLTTFTLIFSGCSHSQATAVGTGAATHIDNQQQSPDATGLSLQEQRQRHQEYGTNSEQRARKDEETRKSQEEFQKKFKKN